MREKLIKLIANAIMKRTVRSSDGYPVTSYLERVVYEDKAAEILADHLLDNGVVVRSAKPMRVEVTTDDFRDLESARAKGCYRKHFFCPSCDIEIGHQTFDSKRKFGQGTVLHSNRFPNCCPCCGERLRMEDNDGAAQV